MAIFDFLKKEKTPSIKEKKEIKQEKIKKTEKPRIEKISKKPVSKKIEKPAFTKEIEGKKKEKIQKKAVQKPSLHRYSKHYEQGYQVLKSVHITEKATELAEKNQYIFKVFENANKQEIKKVVESIYNVDVVSVRTINIHRKRKRLGKSTGWKQGYKKAIVKIKKGQEIEILPR
jgi:large subunit ribosomal protein L23